MMVENQSSFYTSTGKHVYMQSPVEGIDPSNAITRVEEVLPVHLFSEIEMIVFGWFDEFEERSIDAFYQDGALYLSNIQIEEDSLVDDMIHEIGHACETAYSYEIYGDQKLQDEFLRKRKHLHDILWQSGYKVPMAVFMNTEFDQEFDDMLFKKIGYDKLDQYAAGLFISSYASTSLREYFATAFTDFYTNPDHKFLKKVSPQAYNKVLLLQNENNLDNH